MIRTLSHIMAHYGCTAETAQRYIDLRDEGYPQHGPLLMAGLTDAPDDRPTAITDYQARGADSMMGGL